MLEIFKSIPAGGTFFNCITVIIGSLIGLFAGQFIQDKTRSTIFNCLGLFTCYIGIKMTLDTKNSIAVLVSLVLGAITGEFLGLEDKLNSLGDKLRERFSKSDTLLFCVGAMAIIGAFNDGLRHDPEILITKGIMDGVVSVIFAGSFGIGVLFSVIPMFIYQGAFTLAASLLDSLITPEMYANISGVGGLMIMGIGLNLLGIKKIKLCDMLPGLLYVILFTKIFA